MRPSASWAIDSEPIQTRGIIVNYLCRKRVILDLQLYHHNHHQNSNDDDDDDKDDDKRTSFFNPRSSTLPAHIQINS